MQARPHILTTICRELHAEYGTLLPADYRPQMSELELAWVLHSAIFYYSVRKHIFQLPVFDDHSAFIERTVDLFLSGAARHVAEAALPDPHAQHSREQSNRAELGCRADRSTTYSNQTSKHGFDMLSHQAQYIRT